MAWIATGGARKTEHCVVTGGAKRNDAMKSNGTKGSPQAVPTEMMRRYDMTRVATGGAQTIENCVATGGAQRHDAMKSNGTKGSPLAAPELSQKSVQPYVYMYPMHECMCIVTVLYCSVMF